LQMLDSWWRDGLDSRVTFTLTPTLCSMLRDPLLMERYTARLRELITLAEQECIRTTLQPQFQAIAEFYFQRLSQVLEYFEHEHGDLVNPFKRCQDRAQIDIVTSAATHAVLPLLIDDRPALRAQLLVAHDHYVSCFGRKPRGIWLPECAYAEGLDTALSEAELQWFAVDTHGLLYATPQPLHAVFAPVLTPAGPVAFGRDVESARQVWSRHEGYPGDPRYREFYRDIGHDLEFDYIRPYLPGTEHRGFTGIKYFRITGGHAPKEPYSRTEALRAAEGHAEHFLDSRAAQFKRLAKVVGDAPLVLALYDAELFGHWWYEGPEFLDAVVRKAASSQALFQIRTPADFLAGSPMLQVAQPAASSWGEGGHLGMWLNEKNEWAFRAVKRAQQGMHHLANSFTKPDALQTRALQQAARELLLAQASDWTFMLRTGTSPEYATRNIKGHLSRFTRLEEQLLGNSIDEDTLLLVENSDNIFPDIRFEYWRT